MQRSSVVLPEPLAPIRTTHLARADRQIDTPAAPRAAPNRAGGRRMRPRTVQAFGGERGPFARATSVSAGMATLQPPRAEG